MIPWPFPHVVMDGAFEDDLLDQVVGEFPDPASSAWGVFDNPRERKQACEDERFFGLATGHLLETLRSEEYCNNLGYLFGIPDLTFTQVPPNIESIRGAIERWAEVAVTLTEAEEVYASARRITVGVS